MSELGYFYLLPLLLLVANILNVVWGEFSAFEIKRELRTFYGCPMAANIKRISAVILLLMIVWGVQFVYKHEMHLTTLVAFSICTGALSGCFMITLAHDLLHSRSKIDHFLSSALLVATGIPHLAAEHVFGHHRLIGLERDASTAKLNQSFYGYFLHVAAARIRHSFFIPFVVPRFMRRRIIFQNALLGISWLGIAVLIFLITGPAFTCTAFFLMQGLVAYILYELINYIQHYGLKRNNDKDPVTQELSWNCYYKYTNYILFMLPLHSLHHLPASGKRIKTEQLKEGPRMPYLYFVMIAIALIPPLWFKKMNHLAIQHNQEGL